MKKLLLAGLAGVFLAGPVLADDHDGGWRGHRDEHRGDRRDEDRGGWRDDRHDDRRGGWDRDDRRRGYGNGPDSRWDGPRYRGAADYYPQGYGYRSWGVGYRLPQVYFGGRYFIGNPDYYRLPPAYGGTRWIRVGPDALLIRLGDGIVLRAIRGLYW